MPPKQVNKQAMESDKADKTQNHQTATKRHESQLPSGNMLSTQVKTNRMLKRSASTSTASPNEGSKSHRVTLKLPMTAKLEFIGLKMTREELASLDSRNRDREMSTSDTTSLKEILSHESASSVDSRVLAISAGPSIDIDEKQDVEDIDTIGASTSTAIVATSTSAEVEATDFVEFPENPYFWNKAERDAYYEDPESTKRWFKASLIKFKPMTATEMKEFLEWTNKIPLKIRMNMKYNPVNCAAYDALDNRNKMFRECWLKHLRIVWEAAVYHTNLAMYRQLQISLKFKKDRNLFVKCNIATGMEMTPCTINGNAIPLWMEGDIKKKAADSPETQEQRLFNEALFYANAGALLYWDYIQTIHRLSEWLMAGKGIIPYTSRHRDIAIALSTSSRKFFGSQNGCPATLPRNREFIVEEIEVDEEMGDEIISGSSEKENDTEEDDTDEDDDEEDDAENLSSIDLD